MMKKNKKAVAAIALGVATLIGFAGIEVAAAGSAVADGKLCC